MELKVTNNKEEIEGFIKREEIFKKASHDCEIDKDSINIPIGDVIYIAGYDGDDILGLSCFHQFKDGLKFHPYVLRKYNLKGREFVEKSIGMVKCNLYVEIPKDDKLLFNLAKKLGFDSIANNKANRILMRLKNGIHN